MPQLSSETEVSIALLCQLCLIFYTAVRIKKCLKSTSVVQVATKKIWTISWEAITCNYQINAFHYPQR